MLDNVQIIKENDKAKFAVIPFAEYQTLRELLTDPDRLTDYLDYLRLQQVKAQDDTRWSRSKPSCRWSDLDGWQATVWPRS